MRNIKKQSSLRNFGKKSLFLQYYTIHIYFYFGETLKVGGVQKKKHPSDGKLVVCGPVVWHSNRPPKPLAELKRPPSNIHPGRFSHGTKKSITHLEERKMIWTKPPENCVPAVNLQGCMLLAKSTPSPTFSNIHKLQGAPGIPGHPHDFRTLRIRIWKAWDGKFQARKLMETLPKPLKWENLVWHISWEEFWNHT